MQKTINDAGIRLQNVKLIIIDEISMLDANLLFKVNERLKQFGKNDLPFGGYGVILMGDFFQMHAIGTSLLSTIMHPNDSVGDLMRCLTRHQFTEQWRLNPDQKPYADCLNHFRVPSLSVGKGGPVIKSGIMDRLKFLKSSDFESDPVWFDAPIVVSHNSTRHGINEQQALRFAKRRNETVFRWYHKLTEATEAFLRGVARESNQTFENVRARYRELQFDFVSGAPAMIKKINDGKNLMTNLPGV